MSVPRRAQLDEIVDVPTAKCTPRRAVAPAAADESSVFEGRKPGVLKRAVAPVAALAVVSTSVILGLNHTQDAPTVVPEDSSKVAFEASDRQGTNAVSRSQDREALDVAEPVATLGLASEIAPTPVPAPADPPAPAPVGTPAPVPEVPALGKVTGSQFATGDGVNIREKPETSAKSLGKLSANQEVQITDAKKDKWQQISWQGGAAWVSAEFLTATKPVPVKPAVGKDVGGPGQVAPAGGFSTEPCKYGSSIESGITDNTKRVFRAFCANFPQFKTYGGYRKAESWSYHTRGAAIDAMIPDSDTGWAAAKWVVANADALNVDQVIFAQKIWTKSNRTWRPMADRGSITANHYDHVHISVG